VIARLRMILDCLIAGMPHGASVAKELFDSNVSDRGSLMTTIDAKAVFLQMVGGKEEHFFQEHWRKRILFMESVLPQLQGFYDYHCFLEDYKRVDVGEATLLVSVTGAGTRRMVRPKEKEAVQDALDRGISVVLQALMLPETCATAPQQWRWFVALHDALCEYLLPGFPSRITSGGVIAAVDIFCTASESSTGGHYDTGDVFYFVLDGEKEWTIEPVPNIEAGRRLALNYEVDQPSLREHMTLRLRPGDCLYVPPYTYHRVCSSGPSLAVSLGLPTFTEVTLLQNELSRLQQEQALYQPLPSYPRGQHALYCEAAKETRRRTLNILESVSLMTAGFPQIPASTLAEVSPVINSASPIDK